MKQPTKPGTALAVARNIEAARRALGEIDYLSFMPARAYHTKKGFVAVRTKPFLYPDVVLLRSRGSFLELRVTDPLFTKPIVEYLRKVLWVPLYISDPLYHTACGPVAHVHAEQQEELLELLARARLP